MSRDSNSTGVPVAVAAPVSSRQAEALPRADAVTLPSVPVRHELRFTEADITSAATCAIKSIVQNEVSTLLHKEQKRADDQLSSFKAALTIEMHKTVSSDVAAFLKNYAKNELHGIISSRADVLFPRFVADSSVVKKHLAEHLQAVNELVCARKREISVELDALAKSAADKMTRQDAFGYIYESVVRTANSRVTEESKRVQVELFEQVEADLASARQQRDVAVAQFERLTARLEGNLREQQRFKVVALSGFFMGVVSLSSVVLSSLFDKRL